MDFTLYITIQLFSQICNNFMHVFARNVKPILTNRKT